MRPQSASAEPITSELKCMTSAASASLFVAWAMRQSAKPRDRSTRIETIRTPNAQTLASIETLASLSRWIASTRMKKERREEEAGLDQGGDRLDLAMSIGVLFVGGFARHADGEEGDDRDAGIDEIMAGFRQQRERAGKKPRREFRKGQRRADADRRKCRSLLEMLRRVHGTLARGRSRENALRPLAAECLIAQIVRAVYQLSQ